MRSGRAHFSSVNRKDSQYLIELCCSVCCLHIKLLSISRLISTIHLFPPARQFWFVINGQSAGFNCDLRDFRGAIRKNLTRYSESRCATAEWDSSWSAASVGVRRQHFDEATFFWQSLSRHKFSLDSTELSSHLTHVNMCRKKCITDLLVRVLPPWVISDAAPRKTTQVERSTVAIFQDLSGNVGSVVSCHRFIFEVVSLCHRDTASSAASPSHSSQSCHKVLKKINSFSYTIVNRIDNPPT